MANLVRENTPWLYSFWKFARPHTVIGTTCSILGLYLIVWSDRSLLLDNKMAMAVEQASCLLSLFLTSLLSLFLTWLACFCGNVYIVGLNQLEDVAIDKINKPQLPLASGEFSRSVGESIVIATGILALLLSLFQGPFLLATVAVSLTIGTAYSLPPIRLKRFPFWAALCIFTVRGVIVNLGLFCHLQWVAERINNYGVNIESGLPEIQRIAWLPTARFNLPEIPPTVWALTGFILVFTFAIAIFKDIPDIEGDRQYNISTLTIKAGTKTVFDLARGVLTFCYSGLILVLVFSGADVNLVFLGISHLIILGLMWWRSREVDLEDKGAIASFYQFIWKLFFLEYLIFPLACLLA
ncbi:MAG: homogentisate phytyltransferase [Cyanobacteriota bacterium]|nr:homogentisate phytyltransferase [Cyanobacteriota bacterium]